MKKKTILKISIGAAGFIILVVAVLFVVHQVLVSKKKNNTTYTVKSETYENIIEIAGTISAAQEQSLQALSDGTVVGIYVEKGQKVKKGDIIIQLDDTTEQYNLAKHDYDMDTTRITGSKKEIELMQIQRTALLQKIADRKVVATFDGIIADLDVSVGDSLEAKDEIGTIIDRTYLSADVEIAETDVQKLVVGQKVSFTFPAYDGNVEGTVVSWPAIGEVTSRGVTVVNAEVHIENPPDEILPNYSFTGKIEISPTQEFLVVERYAVGYDGGKPYVQKKGSTEKISVVARPYDTDYVKIASGVSSGDVLQAQSVSSTSGGARMRGSKAGGGMAGGGMGGPPPGVR